MSDMTGNPESAAVPPAPPAAVPSVPEAVPGSIPPAAGRPSRRWLVPLAAGVAGLIVGAGGVGLAWGLSGSDAPVPFTLRGSLSLTNPVPLDSNYTRCAGSDGYDDIAQGAAVTVYDDAGKVVGSGSLGAGRYASTDSTAPCVFRFAVPGVPSGSKYYQVEVSHRGKLTVSAADAKAGRFASSLG